jgi:DHA1 family multidrug resistance protein-like MFS transporter
MTPRAFLVLMTAIAVVGDALLHAFYPQYFAAVFGISDPIRVGLYVASCSLGVLLAFPIWALLSKKVPVLRLLIATQSVACVLALCSFATTSLERFWFVSLAMMVFKASYLLIYPYVMSLEDKSKHLQTIGLLAFVVYFGHILAALAAGFVFQYLGPRALFLAMAAGDALQTALCVSVIGTRAFSVRRAPRHQRAPISPASAPRWFLYKLGLVMFSLYFSAYLTEPFFSQYWEESSSLGNRVVSGIVFAIPGIAALAALIMNARGSSRGREPLSMTSLLALTIVGLAFQLSGQPVLIVAGRFVYGWALFQVMVRLDLLVFRVGSPENYAVDFSRVNLFQGLGVMFASSLAGSAVQTLGPKTPFVLATVGFAFGALQYFILFKGSRVASDDAPFARDSLEKQGTVTP